MGADGLVEGNMRRVVARLTGAGWGMAEGADVLGRAYLAYDSGRMRIEVEHHYERPELVLSLVAPDGREVTVYPVYGERPDAVLDVVVGFQDRVGPDDFRDAVRELVGVCPEVYVQDGEDAEPRLLTRDSNRRVGKPVGRRGVGVSGLPR